MGWNRTTNFYNLRWTTDAKYTNQNSVSIKIRRLQTALEKGAGTPGDFPAFLLRRIMRVVAAPRTSPQQMRAKYTPIPRFRSPMFVLAQFQPADLVAVHFVWAVGET
jgi:hypothetical protein